ncbi:MAG TPA: dienelactone hydrolase family protein [Acidobacteriaceae bacterium]|nr:dienelactone hydrolase family protein [Acidobacteriaceae bacterium]
MGASKREFLKITESEGLPMGEHVKLRAADGFELDGYVARPAGEPVAGLVVVQEAFGVNRHIREVTDGWAADGFLAVAPALFDRVQRGVELGYGPEDLQKGMAIIRQGDTDDRVMDVAAALEYARRETGRKVGVIGYCLGGSMAWLAAMRLNPDAAVGYYGSMIAKYGGEPLRAPVMLHFGQEDTHIPKDEIEAKVAAAHPEVPIYFYAGAGHGFNTTDRASYNPEAARLARERSLEFLKKKLSV